MPSVYHHQTMRNLMKPLTYYEQIRWIYDAINDSPYRRYVHIIDRSKPEVSPIGGWQKLLYSDQYLNSVFNQYKRESFGYNVGFIDEYTL